MLATFLACLCLAVGGVVGQLTDADFAKFGAFIDARLAVVLDKIDVIDTKIDDIKFDLSKNHFFNRIRIEVLQNVSKNFVRCLDP